MGEHRRLQFLALLNGVFTGLGRRRFDLLGEAKEPLFVAEGRKVIAISGCFAPELPQQIVSTLEMRLNDSGIVIPPINVRNRVRRNLAQHSPDRFRDGLVLVVLFKSSRRRLDHLFRSLSKNDLTGNRERQRIRPRVAVDELEDCFASDAQIRNQPTPETPSQLLGGFQIPLRPIWRGRPEQQREQIGFAITHLKHMTADRTPDGSGIEQSRRDRGIPIARCVFQQSVRDTRLANRPIQLLGLEQTAQACNVINRE